MHQLAEAHAVLDPPRSLVCAPRHPAIAAPTERLSCRVLESFEQALALREEWDALVRDTHGDIYRTFDWCRIWWSHYGADRRPRIITVRECGRLVGLAPMFLEDIGAGPLTVRVCKPIGSDFTLSVCDPPVLHPDPRSVFRLVLDELFASGDCDLASFGPMSETLPHASALHDVCAERPDLVRIARDRSNVPHTIFQLNADLDAYLRSLGKRERENYRRMSRLAKRDGLTSDMITCGPQVDAEFGRFVSMHAAQWRQKGRLGHFGDWPGAAEFHAEVVRDASARNRLRLFRMSANGQPLAYRYALAFGGRYSSILPARRFGPPWDRYGIGRLSFIGLVDQAIGEGVQAIESGRGHYEHKQRLGGTEHPLHVVTVMSSRFLSRVRGRVSLGAADLLDVLYYKIWFCRLSPKLRVRRRPLWTAWLRSRL